ncbi:hypothetical protein CH256_02795 [Rhodococcus sp. 05-2254-6]|uniref:MarR family winged helix-turn-helix transcriptional regulator n=1 Tax=Rhodococcus sp. 05-2254-6 TaxID=2022489 RepID=UPI000B9B489F|nr:MarR family transcriptional regulator [Rhodococcus sp. 05-2254-6]OZE43558.1 hypothetical protein CH256_02795 [Rhodococcus sp. 05-2254-6]
MTLLNESEMALWHAWKRAQDAVWTRVTAEIADRTGLSDQDFAVLTRVHEIGHGVLRQSALAALLEWHRSRLSHHLTRMADRGLITRRPVDGGVEVVLTEVGRDAVVRARPVHAEAVRRYLLDAIPASERVVFERILAGLMLSAADH